MIVEDYRRGRNLPPVRVTGIDVSEPALEEARRAVYPATRVDKVPPRWLTSYFTREGRWFRGGRFHPAGTCRSHGRT